MGGRHSLPPGERLHLQSVGQVLPHDRCGSVRAENRHRPVQEEEDHHAPAATVRGEMELGPQVRADEVAVRNDQGGRRARRTLFIRRFRQQHVVHVQRPAHGVATETAYRMVLENPHRILLGVLLAGRCRLQGKLNSDIG